MVVDSGALIALIALFVAAIGGIIARDRQMAKAIKEGDDRLHRRIDDVKDSYVRREDLTSQLTRLRADIREIKTEMHTLSLETTKRLDTFLQNLSSRIPRD